MNCLKHRKTAQTDATALVSSIIGKVISSISDPVIDRADLVKITVETLKRFDRAASVQYRAYHPL